MKKVSVFILAIMIISVGLTAEIVPLPDIKEPIQIAVDESQIYISEGRSISIYSLKDFSLRKQFGREGEGPQEFSRFIVIQLLPDSLGITSFGKLSFFTKGGEFKREVKAIPFTMSIQPLGENFVSRGALRGDPDKNTLTYSLLNIYDSNFKKVKEILRSEDNYQERKGLQIIGKPFIYQVYNNKIWVVASMEFIIEVFDNKGEKLFSITTDYERKKITSEDKKEFMDFLKTDPETRDRYESFFKPEARFPEYFPAIRHFLIANDQIYVWTWKKDKDKIEFFVFDLKGKLLKKLFLPIVLQSVITVSPFTIEKGKIYQLVENLDEEMWKLHITEIK